MDDYGKRRSCFRRVADGLVLRITDEGCACSVKGRKETLDAVARYLAPGEIVELIMAIGFWGMVARILETTEVDLEEFAGKVNLLEGRKPMD